MAVAHFVWSHGDGQYKNSQLRQHVINNDLDYNGMISYLNSNWDTSKPANQKVNDADFTIYYSANPWQPTKDLSYYYSQISQFLSNSVATSPIATYSVSGIVIVGIVAMGVGVYKLIANRKK